jgi:hypothetical protein
MFRSRRSPPKRSAPDRAAAALNQFGQARIVAARGEYRALWADMDVQPVLRYVSRRKYLVSSSLFLAHAGSCGPSAGTYFPAVDDGVVVMLKPLSAGSHLLHFTGSFPAFHFVFDITYHLMVSP